MFEILLMLYAIGYFIALIYATECLRKLNRGVFNMLDLLLSIFLAMGSWLSVIFIFVLSKKKK